MPSQTFINLAEEKKQRIFNAIYTELQRVPFPEMSINQVIKNAGIPRGSFYQYFDNKDDAFDYFVSECSRKTKDCVIKRISTIRGDIFDMAKTLFEEFARTSAEQYKFDFFNHVMPYVDLKKLVPFTSYVANMEEAKKFEACSALGIGNLDIKNEEELMDIIGIIEALFQNAVPHIISGDTDMNDIINGFKRKLNIIKKATVREGI